METPGAPPDSPTLPGGLFLALDTSSPVGSVALGFLDLGAYGGGGVRPEDRGRAPPPGLEVLARGSLDAQEEHSALLLPTIQSLLEEVGKAPEDLEGIVLGAGPGSFTGLRVAAATAKGMARALGLAIWPVSSLMGAAAAVDQDPLRPRCVLFDARGDRVYAGAFRIIHGTVETLVEPTAATMAEVLDHLVPAGSLLMGSAAVRHRDQLVGSGNPVLSLPQGLPSAEGLLRRLVLEPIPSPLRDPARWEPAYLRDSGAERIRKAAGEKGG